MIVLRWIVGIMAAAFAVGWVALVVVASGFRRSFGASAGAWWVAAAPLVVAAIVLATVLWPGWPARAWRWLR